MFCISAEIQSPYSLFADLAKVSGQETEGLAIFTSCWNAKKFNDVGNTTCCISASTETEQINSVAWLPYAYYCCVTIDDSFCQTTSNHLKNLVGKMSVLSRFRGTDTVDVKTNLFVWINRGVWPRACCSEQFIHVGSTFVRQKSAFVAGSICENQNIFSHSALRQLCARFGPSHGGVSTRIQRSDLTSTERERCGTGGSNRRTAFRISSQ